MGGSSRQPDIPKHSFRLEFREQYGEGKLRYPLYKDAPFGEGATETFDELVVSVLDSTIPGCTVTTIKDLRGEQPRDQWVRDLQFAMGHHSTRGRYAHVYLNGMYWGIYNLQERPAAPFFEEYFGGDKDTDWDVINSNEPLMVTLEPGETPLEMHARRQDVGRLPGLSTTGRCGQPRRLHAA